MSWGDRAGVTWENAPDDVKERFALTRLFWFQRMVDGGGPDGSDLDAEVAREAAEAAAWWGPRLEAAAQSAAGGAVRKATVLSDPPKVKGEKLMWGCPGTCTDHRSHTIHAYHPGSIRLPTVRPGEPKPTWAPRYNDETEAWYAELAAEMMRPLDDAEIAAAARLAQQYPGEVLIIDAGRLDHVTVDGRPALAEMEVRHALPIEFRSMASAVVREINRALCDAGLPYEATVSFERLLRLPVPREADKMQAAYDRPVYVLANQDYDEFGAPLILPRSALPAETTREDQR